MTKLSVVLAIGCVLQACPSDRDGDGGGDQAGEDACPERIRDTLGFEYAYDCDTADVSVVPESPTPPECDPDVAIFRLHPTRGMPRICYFQAEPGASGGTTSADACRPMACSTRDECPLGTPCADGICRLASLPLTEDSAYPLCLADIPWPKQCSFDALHPDFIDRLGPLLEACPDDGDSCTLPPECPR